jgi:two-component system, NarL family, nitrate/nitrite response regulator NarL
LEREKVIASFRAGAKGVFCRNEPLSELHSCIDRVSQGRIWARAAEAEYLLEAIQSAPTCDGLGEVTSLTKRETAVAELTGQGLSNKQIAQVLGISEHTVKNHLFHIFDK